MQYLSDPSVFVQEARRNLTCCLAGASKLILSKEEPKGDSLVTFRRQTQAISEQPGGNTKPGA